MNTRPRSSDIVMAVTICPEIPTRPGWLLESVTDLVLLHAGCPLQENNRECKEQQDDQQCKCGLSNHALTAFLPLDPDQNAREHHETGNDDDNQQEDQTHRIDFGCHEHPVS